jgi:hypothetical protein
MRAVSLIRWCRPGFIAVAVCGFAGAGRAQEATPDIAREMKKALRDNFAYQATVSADPAPMKIDPGVILLPRVVVRNRWEAEGLDEAIAHQESLNDRFTLNKGGTLKAVDLGRGHAAVGVWYDDDHKNRGPTHGAVPGLNLLKFAW